MNPTRFSCCIILVQWPQLVGKGTTGRVFTLGRTYCVWKTKVFPISLNAAVWPMATVTITMHNNDNEEKVKAAGVECQMELEIRKINCNHVMCLWKLASFFIFTLYTKWMLDANLKKKLLGRLVSLLSCFLVWFKRFPSFILDCCPQIFTTLIFLPCSCCCELCEPVNVGVGIGDRNSSNSHIQSSWKCSWNVNERRWNLERESGK